MMTHTDIQEAIFEGYDGELPPDAQARCDAHLSTCAECRARLNDWRMTAEKVLHPLRLPASERFVQDVMRGVRSQSAERPPALFRWAFPALALSMAGFALTLLYIEHASPSSTEAVTWVDQDQAVSAEWNQPPSEDQILGTAAETL